MKHHNPFNDLLNNAISIRFTISVLCGVITLSVACGKVAISISQAWDTLASTAQANADTLKQIQQDIAAKYATREQQFKDQQNWNNKTDGQITDLRYDMAVLKCHVNHNC